jgi:hypothetical protein
VKEIEDALNTKIDYSDRESAERKMNACLNLVGVSAKNVSKCKGDLERAKAKVLKNHPELNSRLIKMKMDAQTVDEQEALELAERLWVGLHKTIDGLKSLLAIQEKEIKW